MFEHLKFRDVSLSFAWERISFKISVYFWLLASLKMALEQDALMEMNVLEMKLIEYLGITFLVIYLVQMLISVSLVIFITFLPIATITRPIESYSKTIF